MTTYADNEYGFLYRVGSFITTPPEIMKNDGTNQISINLGQQGILSLRNDVMCDLVLEIVRHMDDNRTFNLDVAASLANLLNSMLAMKECEHEHDWCYLDDEDGSDPDLFPTQHYSSEFGPQW